MSIQKTTFAFKRHLFVCLACLVFAVPTFAQTAPVAPLELTWENIFTKNQGASQAAISPDGKVVAVTARSGRQAGIFLVPVDGSSQPEFWVAGGSPIWTSDGKAIVYSRGGDFWKVDVGAGQDDAVRITKGRQGGRAGRLSADDKSLAFYAVRNGSQDIWTVPVDGSASPKQLTKDSMAADERRFAPAWSPDGKQIAYFCNRSNYWEDDIWIVDVETLSLIHI